MSRLRTVLVVEDEHALRASLIAGLASGLHDTDVVGAATLAEAVRRVAQADVIVSDIDLPDGLGVELIGEVARRSLPASIVFITAYRAAYGPLIPKHAKVELFEKPVSMERLRRAVASRLGDERPPPSPFTVADYVQLACMGGHGVTIEASWPGGAARVEIVSGELWSARDPSGTGEAAFARFAFRDDLEVRCSVADSDPGARNVHRPWESVIMDLARQSDEERRDAGSTRERSSTLPSASEPRDRFEALSDAAVDAMLAHDYPRALELLRAARELRPDDHLVRTNLERLRALGYGE